jgi:3-oxoacyl-[acyl-carrier protein] reductase
VLVNNAGVFEAHPIAESSYEQWKGAWQRTLAVNLVGAANVTWCALRYKGARRADRRRRLAGSVPRRAGPARLRGEQAAPGRLRAVAGPGARPAGDRGHRGRPGFTETDMAAEALSGEQGRARRTESPLGRVATPAEVAAAIVFLASPEAEMTSGSVLDVNGASQLRM